MIEVTHIPPKMPEKKANELLLILEKYLTENGMHLDAFYKASHAFFLEWIVDRIIRNQVSSCYCRNCDFCRELAKSPPEKIEVFITDLLNCR